MKGTSTVVFGYLRLPTRHRVPGSQEKPSVRPPHHTARLPSAAQVRARFRGVERTILGRPSRKLALSLETPVHHHHPRSPALVATEYEAPRTLARGSIKALPPRLSLYHSFPPLALPLVVLAAVSRAVAMPSRRTPDLCWGRSRWSEFYS
ncbi:hypothetical protein BD626DRAFT_485039 [Schizophyllum amplum]|uniref:Uncharacterized protein n=1 Tax=Schizophyllum amplum TaxID=97359 RepID=A0A550CQW4_9AGAR|nr:hypothetical protein BD626DRAFT_485039 [Auriculariopsis ampla]